MKNKTTGSDFDKSFSANTNTSQAIVTKPAKKLTLKMSDTELYLMAEL
jgi:hypothetical protein